MYQLNDTIVAVSSPTSDGRVILRMSGPGTVDVLRRLFHPSTLGENVGLVRGSVAVDAELSIDADLYFFAGPRSYTGQDVAELHINTNRSVTEALLGMILGARAAPVRMAGPGEFTARAYLNGKMDLTQAEAVNEVVVSSNRYQLAAAENLLAGRLGGTAAAARAQIIECLTLIEAGLDFSEEDIEFITRPEALERLGRVKERLQELLSGSITYESVIGLPAVGIAGVPNAGKSSLLNCLLGRRRSIVSDKHKTTRDVLTGILTLKHCRCVLFDCAGLTTEPTNILDELAQEAATEALQNSSVVVFCIDVSKTDYSEDVAIRELIPGQVVPVATKCDLLGQEELDERVRKLNRLFSAEFVPLSAQTGAGVGRLREVIDLKVTELGLVGATRPELQFSKDLQDFVALTARHRQAVIEAVDNVDESIDELKAGNDELTAMMLRAAYQALSTIEQQNIDEQILQRIFSRFCIGK
jgi:tRNA modification GTPase